jgi:hypothetical protein
MKIETTRKYIKSVYGNCLYSVGYCDCWHLTRGCEPFAYNCGVYGWNCDYYYINGICISTGYRPHGICTHGITSKFEKQARKIWESKYNYKTKYTKIAKVRDKWIETLRKEAH